MVVRAGKTTRASRGLQECAPPSRRRGAPGPAAGIGRVGAVVLALATAVATAGAAEAQERVRFGAASAASAASAGQPGEVRGTGAPLHPGGSPSPGNTGAGWVPPTFPGLNASLATPQETLPGGPDRWQLILVSAIVPGSGQLLQGQSRGILYLLAEGLVWIGFNWERDRARNARGSYQRLAWEVARDGAGAPTDGDFEYYERLTQWRRSGAFDADPSTPGVQPEMDRTTFNGDAWRLAANLFLGGGPGVPGTSAYEQALAFYSGRAYQGPFLWDWGATGNAWGTYQFLVRDSDRRFERASLILGGALLTRAVSTVDTFLSTATRHRASLRVEGAPRGVPGLPGGGLAPAAIPPGTTYLVLSLSTP